MLAALAPGNRPNIGVRGEFTRRVMERLGLGDSVAVDRLPLEFPQRPGPTSTAP